MSDKEIPVELLQGVAMYDAGESATGISDLAMRDFVHFYNGKNGTDFDPETVVSAYFDWISG